MKGEDTTSIRINKVKKEQYKKFGREHGYNSFSKMIKHLLDEAMRNPSILEPTASLETAEMLESIEKSFSVFDELTEYLKIIDEKLRQLDGVTRLQKKMAKKIGLSETEIKKAFKEDLTGEAVFEE
ncbi:MAG: hypothetical protein ACFFAJ_09335 [Candidatus Hodarchaeota archaeon]